MLHSFPILFALLVAIPGLLIPLYIIVRMYHVLIDGRRGTADRTIARVTMALMVVLMAVSGYAAQEIYTSLNNLTSG